MEITVRITKNYGQEAIYPANEKAEMFTSLLGKKTLSRSDISRIKDLGFNVSVAQEAL